MATAWGVSVWHVQARQWDPKQADRLKIERRDQEERRKETIACKVCRGQHNILGCRSGYHNQRRCPERGRQTKYGPPGSNRRQGGNRGGYHGDCGGPHHIPHSQYDRQIGFQNGRPIRSPPDAQCSHKWSQTTVCHSNQADDDGCDVNIILLAVKRRHQFWKTVHGNSKSRLIWRQIQKRHERSDRHSKCFLRSISNVGIVGCGGATKNKSKISVQSRTQHQRTCRTNSATIPKM